MFDPKFIRNIAVIAHVDHGKTTLVDAFLKQSNTFKDHQAEMQMEMILDSGELEKEKGITITAKNTSIRYKDYKINIIDTPGHSDFGGEVERTLNLADSCLLIVDAQEGPMPQTKFVLKKAFELNLHVIVVINKIDKSFANPLKTLEKVNDLFLNLAQNDKQLDFPVFYAIGREGKIWDSFPNNINQESNVFPLLDYVVNKTNPPKINKEGGFQMQICSLEYDNHIGRILVGRINRGKVKQGDFLSVVDKNCNVLAQGKVKCLMTKEGLKYQEVQESLSGEIIAIGGIESTAIGSTLCSSTDLDPLPEIKISEPSVQIKFEANTSPFMGKEGKYVSSKELQVRLLKEADTNISLKISKSGTGFIVAGRGELQLSILIETMRREGYEFQLRKPEVVLIKENGVLKEPEEELIIDVPSDYVGPVTNTLALRKATLLEFYNENNQARFIYKILTRNLLGLRNELIIFTKGNIVINSYVSSYVKFVENNIGEKRKGVLISTENGIAMGYALNTIQERGELFIEPGTKVYEGMIIGINKFDNDLEVNPVKERQKSGVRVKHDEITQTTLKTPKKITLDFAILFIAIDEMVEVTPENIRLRKIYLTKTQRDWSKRKSLADFAKKEMVSY